MMLIISARRLYSETIYCISFTFFSVGYVLHVVFELMSVFNNLGTLNSGKNFDFSVLSELQQQARCDKYFIVSFLLVALLILFFVRNASKSSRTKMILTIIIEVGLIAVAIAMFVTVQNSPLEVIANRTLGIQTQQIAVQGVNLKLLGHLKQFDKLVFFKRVQADLGHLSVLAYLIIAHQSFNTDSDILLG